MGAQCYDSGRPLIKWTVICGLLSTCCFSSKFDFLCKYVISKLISTPLCTSPGRNLCPAVSIALLLTLLTLLQSRRSSLTILRVFLSIWRCGGGLKCLVHCERHSWISTQLIRLSSDFFPQSKHKLAGSTTVSLCWPGRVYLAFIPR